jgi:lipopolysaccharide biosynthesis glycosyltransferase
MNIAVVTVSSDNFLPGTMVLFQSFLNHNPLFSGDLIVIDGGLSDRSRKQLLQRFGSIFINPDYKINRQLDYLVEKLPSYAKTRARFYSIELFNLKNYGKVLFLDSDMLCLADVSELFLTNETFAVCADHRYHQGFVRQKKTLNPIPKSRETDTFKDWFIERLFNTGLMLVDGLFLNGDIYRTLVEAIIPEAFAWIQTGHTDTVILNNELLGEVTWLNLKYNLYSTLFDSPHFDGIEPAFVHFIGKSKPWNATHESGKWFAEWHKVNRQIQVIPKVFCIGFHKTGTTSLGKVLGLLGYQNCHGAGPLRTYLGDTRMMELLFRKDYEPIFEVAEGYNSFNDNPWFKLYKELDLRFPDSKFILMLRDEDAWLESCIKYFGNSATLFRLWVYGKVSPIGNEKRYLDIYRKHNTDVINYFNNRPDDLLVVDLKNPEKLHQIKKFLDIGPVEVDFPHLNQS